ncbi:hypothetical protein [Halopolyspora algeriensis]|nr:hypothetical protein [Halopolyspora algeriensis]
MTSGTAANAENSDSAPAIAQEETPSYDQLPETPQENTEAGGESTDTGDTGGESTATGATGGFVAGAVATVGAGLGLSSLTGTPLGNMLRSRAEIVGQIKASTGGGGDPVEAFYSAPWHTAALVNGIFAVIAVVLGGGVLLTASVRNNSIRPWVKAVALGGVLLGVLGLLVAGGMYFDLFAGRPEMPAMPGLGR